MDRARTLGGQVPSDPKRGRELVVNRRPGARAARGLLRVLGPAVRLDAHEHVRHREVVRAPAVEHLRVPAVVDHEHDEGVHDRGLRVRVGGRDAPEQRRAHVHEVRLELAAEVVGAEVDAARAGARAGRIGREMAGGEPADAAVDAH